MIQVLRYTVVKQSIVERASSNLCQKLPGPRKRAKKWETCKKMCFKVTKQKTKKVGTGGSKALTR